MIAFSTEGVCMRKSNVQRKISRKRLNSIVNQVRRSLAREKKDLIDKPESKDKKGSPNK